MAPDNRNLFIVLQAEMSIETAWRRYHKSYILIGPSILIMLTVLWHILTWYLFRLLSMNELLLFLVFIYFSSVAHTKLSTSFHVVLSLIADHLGEHMRTKNKESFVKLPIAELLSKKHLSTVINNRTEPPLVLSRFIYFIYDSFSFRKHFASFCFNVSWSLFEVDTNRRLHYYLRVNRVN